VHLVSFFLAQYACFLFGAALKPFRGRCDRSGAGSGPSSDHQSALDPVIIRRAVERTATAELEVRALQKPVRTLPILPEQLSQGEHRRDAHDPSP